LFFGALVFPLLAGAHAMYDLPVAPLGALLAGHLYAAVRSELARWSTQLSLTIGVILASPILGDIACS
jgi:hypothetical protein